MLHRHCFSVANFYCTLKYRHCYERMPWCDGKVCNFWLEDLSSTPHTRDLLNHFSLQYFYVYEVSIHAHNVNKESVLQEIGLALFHLLPLNTKEYVRNGILRIKFSILLNSSFLIGWSQRKIFKKACICNQKKKNLPFNKFLIWRLKSMICWFCETSGLIFSISFSYFYKKSKTFYYSTSQLYTPTKEKNVCCLGDHSI